tara:strand:- start:246 stop:419 length:174 start_codon:yes stop_codon:yes gene_type:complete
MPMGKGTYGSKKGRPPKKAKGKMTGSKKKLAGMYGNKNKITRGDIIAAAKKNKKRKA